MPVSVSKPLIFVVISFLVVALVYSSVSTSGVFAVPPDKNFGGNCTTTGYLETCCWTESVPPGTGNPKLGGDKEEYCQTCTFGAGYYVCGNKELQYLEGTVPGTGGLPEDGVFEQPPTPPPFDPTAPLQGGVFEQQEQQEPPTPPTFAPGTSPGVLEQLEQQTPPPPPFVPGFLERQQQPPPDQGTEEPQPATVEEDQPVPVCQEGLEFNEGLGFCVPTDCPEGQVLDEQTGVCVLEEPEVAEEEPEQQSEPEEQQSSEEGEDSEDNTN